MDGWLEEEPTSAAHADRIRESGFVLGELSGVGFFRGGL